ncbi:MAG: hypothetical protein LLG06_10170 [Desulfobacteraceae bacterium]|nr:hypothetical protein [Desulfobacteraceae bacterium]
MKSRGGAWAIQTLLVCSVFNAALGVLLYLMSEKILEAANQWVVPFISPGAPNMPEELRSAMNNFGAFLAQLREYLKPALALLMASATLPLWFVLFLLGLRQVRRAGAVQPKTETAQEAAPPAGE